MEETEEVVSGSKIMSIFFDYLDGLVAGGECSPDDAKPYLEQDFGLKPLYSKLILVTWKNSRKTQPTSFDPELATA